MKRKLEQVNQSFKKALGQILLKAVPDADHLTVADVLIDPSLQHGRVWLKTTPSTLKRVEEKRPEIQRMLVRYVKTRYTPRLTFLTDDNYLDHLDDLFLQVGTEKADED